MPNIFDQIDPPASSTNVFDRIDPRNAPPSVPDPNAPGLLESFGRGAAEGAAFGYDNKLGMDKDRRELSKATNPWAHFMGEAAGAILPMAGAALLPGGQAPAGVEAAGLLTRGAGLVRSALTAGEMGTLGKAAVQSTKLGGVYGALSGSGHADVNPEDTLGESLKKRGVGALKGGASGAAAGLALGPVAHGLYRGAQALGNTAANAAAETAGTGKGALVTATKGLERDRITPAELIAQIRSEFPDDTQAAGGAGKRFFGPANAPLDQRGVWTQDMVEDMVRRRAAGQSPSEISDALSANGTGPGEGSVKTLLDELEHRHLGPLNLVDRASMARTASGDNTQMLMRASAATPGEHLGVAREELGERQIGAGGRLQDLFSRMVGSSDYAGVAAKHALDLENAGTKAYATAFSNEKPFDLNPVVNKWTNQYASQRGPVPDAMRSAIDSVLVKVPVRNLETGAPVTNELRPPQTLEQFISARQNIRQLIEGERPGTPVYRALTQFNKDLTDTVGKSNPDWMDANNLWREGNAAREALEAGAAMTTRLNSKSRAGLEVLDEADNMAKAATKALRDAKQPINAAKKSNPDYEPTPAQQAAVESAEAKLQAAASRRELFRVGLVRSLNDSIIENSGETHNLTRQLMLPGAKKIMSRVLGSDAEQFYKAVNAEKAMHRTYSSQFGSQTTPLKEAVDELNWAPKFEASMVNPMHWPGRLLNLASEYAARSINASRNKDLMDLYTTTDPMRQMEVLRAMEGIHAARSQAGNAVGKPAISAVGPGMDVLLSGQKEKQTIPPYRP